MPRISSLDAIAKATGAAAPVAKADDFLGRINTTLQNFKELMQMAEGFRGAPAQAPPPAQPTPYDTPRMALPAPAAPSAGDKLLKFIELLAASEYGDKPVGELIDQIKPYSIKQMLELAKHAGLKK